MAFFELILGTGNGASPALKRQEPGIPSLGQPAYPPSIGPNHVNGDTARWLWLLQKHVYPEQENNIPETE